MRDHTYRHINYQKKLFKLVLFYYLINVPFLCPASLCQHTSMCVRAWVSMCSLSPRISSGPCVIHAFRCCHIANFQKDGGSQTHHLGWREPETFWTTTAASRASLARSLTRSIRCFQTSPVADQQLNSSRLPDLLEAFSHLCVQNKFFLNFFFKWGRVGSRASHSIAHWHCRLPASYNTFLPQWQLPPKVSLRPAANSSIPP